MADVTDLWAPARERALAAAEPLALRMRPRTLAEFVGQKHLLGDAAPGQSGKKSGTPLLRRMLDSGVLTSIILHGPPGTGKTTLAQVIANHVKARFVKENAANVSVKRIREIVEEASRRLQSNAGRTALFLDEIHRFSKSQQDVLLEDVERGVITLIGATTENPLFAVNAALVSRSTLFRLTPLTEEDVIAVLRRAIADPDRGVGNQNVRATDDALEHWAVMSEGDARRALNALEVAVLSARKGTQDGAPIVIDREAAEQSIQRKAVVYDHSGDGHYDTISAFIKSVRGSDPDAAVYWLALMLEAGEDPRFIARRLAILASEDIGNADSRALSVADAAWSLVERIGMPEARITLAQCTTYLALAPKSNASYEAIEAASADVREGRTLEVPHHIKDGNVRKAATLSAGDPLKGGAAYAYAHTEGVKSDSLGIIGTQDYLGAGGTRRYYEPTEHGEERALRERLEEARRVRQGEALTTEPTRTTPDPRSR